MIGESGKMCCTFRGSMEYSSTRRGVRHIPPVPPLLPLCPPPGRAPPCRLGLGCPYLVPGGRDASPDLAEPDAGAVGCGGARAEHDLVAVVEERPGRTVGQDEWFRAAPRELQQGAPLAQADAAHRAGCEQVARTDAGAVDGQVREHLRRGPVHAGEPGGADQLAVEPYVEVDVEPPWIRRVVQVGQRSRITSWPRHP